MSENGNTKVDGEVKSNSADNRFIPQKELDLFAKVDKDVKRDSQLVKDIIEHTLDTIKKNRHAG